jgi:hypothetical protein
LSFVSQLAPTQISRSDFSEEFYFPEFIQTTSDKAYSYDADFTIDFQLPNLWT